MTEEEEKTTPPPESQIKTVEEELAEYKDKYLRCLAEMENARKRMHKEKQDMTRFAIDNVLSELLAPIDNLENALNFTEKMSEDVRKWAIGFQMILGQFKEVLHNHGVTSFVSEGHLFDPHLHHAIEIEETEEHPEGFILKEFVKGYKHKDHTLRPARVKVAKAIKQESKE